MKKSFLLPALLLTFCLANSEAQVYRGTQPAGDSMQRNIINSHESDTVRRFAQPIVQPGAPQTIQPGMSGTPVFPNRTDTLRR